MELAVLRGPQARWRSDRFPPNHRLPAVYRVCPERQPERQAEGEQARTPALALVEAALLATDEPLPPRKLVVAAGLADVAEARRLVRKLQALYEADGSAFQVAEIAGGFQLLT